MRLTIAFVLASAVATIEASPRETPTVRLIKKLNGAVLPIFAEPEKGKLTSGTASVIHPDGFMLSNDHVSEGKPGIALIGGKRVRFFVVGRLPGKDIALLGLDRTKNDPIVPVGRSHDLMAGEPVTAAGNPGGRGLVYSQGIISAPSIMRGVNALIISYFKTGRDEFIQFDAASNPGNSGGPLINALGQQIGIVSAGVPGEENVNYAIPMDRVRRLFGHLLPLEVRWDFWVGLEMDFMAKRARVTTVAGNSPASKAGIKVGDVITSAGGKVVRDGLDWPMGLIKRKHREPFEVVFERKGKSRTVTIRPVAFPLADVVPEKGMKPGLKYSVYHGAFKVMPDFGELKIQHAGVTKDLATESLSPDRDENFALVFEGFLKLPKTGLYRLSLGSDDGSKLFMDGDLVIDNDDNHPLQHLSRFFRLKAGLHRLRIEYFDHTGDAELELNVESPKIDEQLVPSDWYFHK